MSSSDHLRDLLNASLAEVLDTVADERRDGVLAYVEAMFKANLNSASEPDEYAFLQPVGNSSYHSVMCQLGYLLVDKEGWKPEEVQEGATQPLSEIETPYRTWIRAEIDDRSPGVLLQAHHDGRVIQIEITQNLVSSVGLLEAVARMLDDYVGNLPKDSDEATNDAYGSPREERT